MQNTNSKIKKELTDKKEITNKKSTKLNRFNFLKFDYLLLFFSTIVVVFSLFIVTLITPPSGNIVEVIYEGDVRIRESLNLSKTITMTKKDYPKLLGDIEITIESGRVRITKETSPNNICSKQGWTDNQFKSLICEPNSVIVRVVTDKEFTIPGDIITGDI